MLADYIDIEKLRTFDEFLTHTQPYGSISKSLVNRMYGIDHNLSGTVAPLSRNSVAYVFITRPQMNMSDANLANNPKLQNLLTETFESQAGFIRNTLDPRLALPKYGGRICSAVDNEMIFIPALVNDIKSLGGAPDRTVPVYVSPEGIRGEQWASVDGTNDLLGRQDITLTFDNFIGDDLVNLFSVWTTMASAVFEGKAIKYPQEIAKKVVDYKTRIYIVVTDETRTKVRMFANCGEAIPTNDTIGSFFDFNRGEELNTNSDTFSIRFVTTGFFYNDFTYIMAFNNAVCIGKNAMYDVIEGQHSVMKKIPRKMFDAFNYRAYPLINEQTFELEWWVDTTTPTYKRVYDILTESGKNIMNGSPTCWAIKQPKPTF